MQNTMRNGNKKKKFLKKFLRDRGLLTQFKQINNRPIDHHLHLQHDGLWWFNVRSNWPSKHNLFTFWCNVADEYNAEFKKKFPNG